MEPSSGFKDIQSDISSSLVTTTRTATQICAEDLGFHRSLDPTIATTLNKQNARLLALAERLLANASAGLEVVGPKLQDLDAVEANWRGVVDVVDSLLEKADTSLDEYSGIIKRLTPGQEQIPAPPPRYAKLTNAFRTKDMLKPQTQFEYKPDNHATGPFKPLLTSKPHAIISLKDSVQQVSDEGRMRYPHPYNHEIESYQYPTSMYTKAEPILYHPFETTTAVLVDTEEALVDMLKELKDAKEIAIDLEHHDSRTYIGVVSLMQISTRNKDWIVDTLKPWRRRLECLNEVFADPNIIKVLHGAYMDIVWLQRDLGLYIVGLFDTHHAARALGYPGGSLAYLLQRFINFSAQKQYQTADWRIRPLPKEMFEYARSDTHFLLYIFDHLRNELIERSDFANPENDRVRSVFEKSMETALQRYEHPIYDAAHGQGPVGWYRLLNKTPVTLSKEQFSVFKAVHEWRDTVARQEDESTHYVMPNHALFAVTRAMPLDRAAVFTCAQPVSPILRIRIDELISVIVKSKAEGANGPEMVDVLKDIGGFTSFIPQQSLAPAALPPPTTAILDRPIASTTLPIKSDSSKFWGGAFLSSLWQQKRGMALGNIRLALPLPPLTAEIFADPSDPLNATQVKTPVDPGARAEHQYIKGSDRTSTAENPGEGIFIVKQLGGTRKRKATEVESSADAFLENDDELTVENASEQLSKAEKKAQRKARKQAKREQRLAEAAGNLVIDAQSGEGNGKEDALDADSSERTRNKMEVDEEPFDYANAPSVLHSSKPDTQTTFNPYKKALNAPKGLARKQKGGVGKSGSFKM